MDSVFEVNGYKGLAAGVFVVKQEFTFIPRVFQEKSSSFSSLDFYLTGKCGPFDQTV